jgi:hypothetical protein
MLELAAVLLCAVIFFLFGVSVTSITMVAAIMVLTFILLSTLSFIFKFGFWILVAVAIYYLLIKKDKC